MALIKATPTSAPREAKTLRMRVPMGMGCVGLREAPPRVITCSYEYASHYSIPLGEKQTFVTGVGIT